MRVLLVWFLLVLCSIISSDCYARGAAPLPQRYALYADFDNKALGQPIGNRGATFGEPIVLSDLDTSVIETTPGHNVLRVSNNLSSTAARRLRWEMMGNAEIIVGEVNMSFDLKPSALDRYSILVRESSGSSKSFLTLTLTPAGTLTASDESGTIGQINYTANAPMHFELVFDMDTRTSRMTVNGSTIFNLRAFGINDRGIGRLFVGYGSGSNGSSFDLDNLSISAPLPFPVALEADFEDKTAGLPIGLGGAVVHEPVTKDASVSAIVLEAAPGVNIIDISSTNTATSQKVRWQFLDNLEVRTGLAIMDFDISMPTIDKYGVSLREKDTSAQAFMTLQHQSDGLLRLSDANGTVFSSGVTYVANRVYQYRVVLDLDAGIYNVFRDGIPLARERAHGVTATGLGAILFSISNGAQLSAHVQMDSLRVSLSKAAEISSDIEFLEEVTTAFEDQPVTPAIKVGVVNILDQPVPDGTVVTLEIASGGPPGETLIGATETTTAGVATFAALEFDSQGTYRLVARSLDVAKLGSVDIVVGPSDIIFSNGFD